MQATSKLILGTVQFGLDYGINNQLGKPSSDDIRRILDLAWAAGIRILDSAEGYGDAHERIGEYHRQSPHRFEVITRFSDSRRDLPADLHERVVALTRQLEVQRLHAYMFHSLEDYRRFHPQFADAIRELRHDDLVMKCGVSVYTVAEANELLDSPDVDIIQLPYNLLDHDRGKEQVMSAARGKGIGIHARSAFLQGLIFAGPDRLHGKLKVLKPYLARLNALCERHRLTMGQLALGYVVESQAVENVIIGVDSADQLRSNLESVKRPVPTAVIGEVDQIQVLEPNLLNPSTWSRPFVIAITQARTTSTRLPGKVLKGVNSHTLLSLHLERILRARSVDKLILATSVDPTDDQLPEIAAECGVECFRGSLDDVLARFYGAAQPFSPDWVVRLTADCPLIDPALIDQVIEHALPSGADYYSNTLSPTFPDGQDIEVFKFAALEAAFREATLKSDREHVTPFIYRNSPAQGGHRFAAAGYAGENDYSAVRLTVDEPEDLEVIRRLVAALGVNKGWKAYADLYNSDETTRSLHSRFMRNEGYERSQHHD